MIRTIATSALLLLAAGGATAAARVEPPVTPLGDIPPAVLPEQAQPVRTYANACASCHDRGGFAVVVLRDRVGIDRALIHERNALSPELIRAVVRNGMGHMPAMSKLEVSDAELDAIIAELGQARTP